MEDRKKCPIIKLDSQLISGLKKELTSSLIGHLGVTVKMGSVLRIKEQTKL